MVFDNGAIEVVARMVGEEGRAMSTEHNMRGKKVKSVSAWGKNSAAFIRRDGDYQSQYSCIVWQIKLSKEITQTTRSNMNWTRARVFPRLILKLSNTFNFENL